MYLRVAPGIRFQTFGHHHRSQVGSANTDIDDVGHRLSRIPCPLAADNSTGKILHFVQLGVYFGHHIATVDDHWPVRPVSERNVQHRAILCFVDMFTVEHAVDGTLEIDVFCQLEKEIQSLRC